MIGSLVCQTSDVTLPLNNSGPALGTLSIFNIDPKELAYPARSEAHPTLLLPLLPIRDLVSISLAETYGRWRKVCQPYDLQAIRTG